MKRGTILLLFVLAATSARAEDKPKEPACGKTNVECQAMVDRQQSALSVLQKEVSAYKSLLTEANDHLVAAASK